MKGNDPVIAADERWGCIIGAIADEKEFDLIRGIVQFQGVGDLLFDAVRFIVGGDDKGDGGKVVIARWLRGRSPDAVEQHHDEGISRVVVKYDKTAAEEEIEPNRHVAIVCLKITLKKSIYV